MCVGVTSRENPPQLSGCTRDFTESANTKLKIRNVIARSFTKISAKVSELSAISPEFLEGACLCNKITWIPINAIATTANRKCKTVNLRIDHEVTVALARTQATTSSPRNGTTLAKFRITKAAQYDIFPDTTTYPVKATASESKKIPDPTSQIRNLVLEITCEYAITFEKCNIVATTTKLASNMCISRRSQTRFPWKDIEINSKYCRSRLYATNPRRKNPVISWIIQKTSAVNATLWPTKVRATGKSAMSWRENKV